MTIKPSTPAHIYQPLTQNELMPDFQDGRNWFPPAEHHFRHLAMHLNPFRYECLPGEFGGEDFIVKWKRISLHINDCWITNIQPKTEYGGI